jgi:hypothetical protein
VIEIVAVLLLLLVVISLGAMGPGGLVTVGITIAGFGLTASVVAGVLYHLALRRALLRLGKLPARWWWAPSRLHGELDEPGRTLVLPYYRAGVFFIAVASGGLFFVAAAAVKAFLLAG